MCGGGEEAEAHSIVQAGQTSLYIIVVYIIGYI